VTAPEHGFPIAGIGASAGGLKPLTRLLGALPPQPGLALVVVQHLDPTHESHLVDLLQPHTSMAVVEAVHGTKVAPNHVYVIQPNTSVAIADGVLSVTPRADDRRPHYPVDHFLRSLAAVEGPQAIGVILSGTGSDGTLGICEVRAAGGLTFAQDDSAQYDGMPRSAIASGTVDLVLPPDQIGAHLATVSEHLHLRQKGEPQRRAPEDAEQFQRVIAALRRTSGVDFSQYRDTTIKRRAARRMLLRGFTTPQAYAQFLEQDHEEAAALYRDVLINVTSFFRNPAMFEALRAEVFPEIVRARTPARPIRIWVPGCSTGQEAYSLAMALTEFLEDVPARPAFQIFATDLGDPALLDRARAGVYPESIEAEVSPERLRRFFTKTDRTYRIEKNIRDLCVFARQNLTVDPPFSRVDLITCRNVLIYMSPPLQERLLPVFHFALNSGGFLVLGQAETIGRFDDLFDPVDRTQKIYRKRDAARRPALTFMADQWLAGASAARASLVPPQPASLQKEADRLVLSRYGPPSVLVNERFEVLQFRGRTAPYLEVPAGKPTTSILRMAKEGLFTELRAALSEALAGRSPVIREHLHVSDAGRDLEFTLHVLPVVPAQAQDIGLLVLFEPADLPAWSAVSAARGAAPISLADDDVTRLRAELTSSQQYLQSIVDQQEAASQELRTAHEEVLSSNEELQSTNEELQTTKEELESANEELTTVNEQFQSRNRDLDQLNDDLHNFISSAGLPMVTVGRDLCVRRLTPAAQAVFNLRSTDVGRSIEHIKFALRVDGVGQIIEQVISSVQPWEQDVTDRDGRWWMLRVHPFLTADNRIDGATLVAVDVDLIKRSHELMEARDYALAIVQTVQEPLVVLGADCRVELANQAFYKLFGVSTEQLTGRTLWEDGDAIWAEPSLRRTLLAACAGEKALANLEIERHLPGIGPRTLVLNARSIVREGRPTLLLLAIRDVTSAREAEALRIDAETLRLLDRRKDEFLGILAHELRNPLAPMRFALEIMRRADGGPPEAEHARQVLERQVTHMTRIVDDLLDVSRITQGRIELRKETLELSAVITSAVELCRPLVDAARHTLTVSLPDEPVVLRADQVRLTQVLVNVLNNAIKFTPPGGHIWLLAEATGEDMVCADQLRIRVRDTGIGITPDMRTRIFDMFSQGDRSLERSRGGLGVGLTLVRNLVALHGGTVEAHSSGVDAGSEFTICLPIDPAAQPAQAAPAVAARLPTARPLRILVADDNDDGRAMLEFFLASEGHTVFTASDGPGALSRAIECRPDVAILDIGMPGFSGYAVAEQLRKAPDGPPPMLVALSGFGQHEDKVRASQAGFDHHFTKPVDIATLTTLLASVPRP
jgi:two-component system, chemotaxis family, CheB/CheR fusion protein